MSFFQSILYVVRNLHISPTKKLNENTDVAIHLSLYFTVLIDHLVKKFGRLTAGDVTKQHVYHSLHDYNCEGNTMQTHEKFIRLTQVLDIIPYSSSHIRRLEGKGKFPKRIRLGENRVAWLQSEVHDWLDQRLNHRNLD